MEQLPVTDHELIVQCQAEYNGAFSSGTPSEVDAARSRLVWALVHATDKKYITRGVQLATQMLQQRTKESREYQYLQAVGCFKLGKYMEARRHLKTLLQEHPGFRQAEFLQGCVDDAIVRDGIVGVGVTAAVAGVAVALIAGLASRRS